MMAIFYFIWGGIGVAGGLGMLIFNWNDPDMSLIKWPLQITTAYWIAVLASACFIRIQRFRGYSLVIAAITTVFFPVGTILGGYTIYLLTTGDARQLYRETASSRRENKLLDKFRQQ
ncbi:MAG TPA: hypothetical protein VG722_03770 [Tepidisphaeraceae bacterium]|nr:hypothetical protein [Tepidisphaeraceae bacterium]